MTSRLSGQNVFLLSVVTCEFPARVPVNVALPVNGLTRETHYYEGDDIVYQCLPGFEVGTTVCGSNGQWTPDPALHNCSGKPGMWCFNPFNSMPLPIQLTVVLQCFPPVVMLVQSLVPLKGLLCMIFQCGEGLFLPSGSNSTIVHCNKTGLWIPSPTTLVCRSQGICC